MKAPLIRRPSTSERWLARERGVTMVLVAVAMVAIIAIAALSIDVITLYLAREEAQRSADAAALTAVRILSVSGMTGDPSNSSTLWSAVCGGSTSIASQAAQSVGTQNSVAGPVPTVNVTYSAPGGSPTADCTSLKNSTFGVNPLVTVQIQQTSLPTFFSRIWGTTGSSVGATATAEAFNPSNSLNTAPNGLVTVNPRCVKPWIVPNRDPINAGAKFVALADGSIQNPGIQVAPGTATRAIIGEQFGLVADCLTGNPNCKHGSGNGLIDNPPGFNQQGPNTLDYVPALIGGTAVGAPSCATGSAYQEAIAGCDQSTVYACGIVGGGAQADLTFNPGKTSGDTATATECVIHQGVGQDLLDSTKFPFQIQAGSGNPVVTNAVITSSNSIVTLPIYDDTAAPGQFTVDQPPVTIVGFLQVFINGIDPTTGNVNVTVLNVAGCSNTATDSTLTVAGTSPVPIRLITPP